MQPTTYQKFGRKYLKFFESKVICASLQWFEIRRACLQKCGREIAAIRVFRYNPNDLYDKMVSRLFRDHLHKSDECYIAFAKRGRSDRSIALRQALEVAQSRGEKKFSRISNTRMSVREAEPSTMGALQAVDYLLWALQRLYERREERYIRCVWPLCHLVHDIDDQRGKGDGVYYTQKSPIELGKLKELR